MRGLWSRPFKGSMVIQGVYGRMVKQQTKTILLKCSQILITIPIDNRCFSCPNLVHPVKGATTGVSKVKDPLKIFIAPPPILDRAFNTRGSIQLVRQKCISRFSLIKSIFQDFPFNYIPDWRIWIAKFQNFSGEGAKLLPRPLPRPIPRSSFELHPHESTSWPATAAVCDPINICLNKKLGSFAPSIRVSLNSDPLPPTFEAWFRPSPRPVPLV